MQTQVEFLGHVITNETAKPAADKVEAVTKFKPPTNQKEVQCVLGLTGYLRKYMPNYASVTHPLSEFTENTINSNLKKGTAALQS